MTLHPSRRMRIARAAAAPDQPAVAREAVPAEGDGVVAPIARVRDWLAQAARGDRFAYATRCCLPPDSKTGAYLRQLHDDGIVSLVQIRVGDMKRTYIAQRTAAPLPSTRGRAVAPEAQDRSGRTKVLKLLRRRAATGRPCPTDVEIAQICTLSGSMVAARIVAELAADGEIVIAGTARRRIVTIVATGEWTEAP